MARLLPLVSLLGIALLSVGCYPGVAAQIIRRSVEDPFSDSFGSDSSSDSSESDSSSASVDTYDKDIGAEVVEVLTGDDDDDADDFADDDELTDDGVNMPVMDLTDQEVVSYLDLEDRIFIATVDEFVARKLIAERKSLLSQGEHARRKRIAPLIGRAAWTVGRSLFRRFASRGATPSGSRLTRHYTGRGNYNTAVRDFNRMRLDNVQPIRNSRFNGYSGTLGPNRHRVTVRDGSSPRSGNRPTLEIRSHNGNLVRKLRYD